MDEEESSQEPVAPKDPLKWHLGRSAKLIERWVEEVSFKTIAKARGVLAEEIRGLARRVERMQELLDQLEQLVESTSESCGEEPNDDERTPPNESEG